MNIYYVHFKGKKAKETFEAFSYTKTDDRYIFHKKEDKSDNDVYCLLDEVIGFDWEPYTPPAVGGFGY